MRLSTVGALALLTGVVVAAGCGSGSRPGLGGADPATGPAPDGGGGSNSSGGFGPGGTGGIEMDPRNATIIIDSATNPATPGTVTYKVTSKGNDVSSSATFELEDPALGTFAGATLTSAGALPGDKLGASTTVRATTPGGGQGAARLTLVKIRKTGPQRDFFFVVPFEQPPSPNSDVLEFRPSIKQVDVVFAMDTTGSMGPSIDNLKDALSGSLFADLQAAIPNVGLAVVDYRDYPVSPYGLTFLDLLADWPVKVRQKVTTTLADAQAAVGQYAAGGGEDVPESQIPAMQHILTGEALTWDGGSVPAATPAPGHFGAVDFRPGSVPVVVNITDATWHAENHVKYNFATPTMASLKSAFTANSAFFVDITSGAEWQADELSDATGSNVPVSAFAGACGPDKCCTGGGGAPRPPAGPGGSCRLNFLVDPSGMGVSAGVVTAIGAISGGASYDTKAVPSNDPANPNGVDATKFIRALRAIDEGNAAAGCPPREAKDSDGDGIKDTFVKVVVGTKVCFEVIPATNTTVAPTDEPQFYNAFVDVQGVQGNIQLDRRSVLFLVPPKDAVVK